MTYTVELTIQECRLAAHQGIDRRLSNIFGNTNAMNLPRDQHTWDKEVNGCFGELGVAKSLKAYWTGMGFSSASDVKGLEIKATAYKTGDLLLQKHNNPDAPYVLAAVDIPRVTLVGWIMGKEALQEKYWNDTKYKRPCYAVPQEDLRPLSELGDYLRSKKR